MLKAFRIQLVGGAPSSSYSSTIASNHRVVICDCGLKLKWKLISTFQFFFFVCFQPGHEKITSYLLNSLFLYSFKLFFFLLFLWSLLLIRSDHLLRSDPFIKLFLIQQSQLDASFLQRCAFFMCGFGSFGGIFEVKKK